MTSRKLAMMAIILITAASAPSLRAQSLDLMFEEGNRLYREGLFQEAVTAYRRLLETGATGAALLFNLGNAYYKSGETARAILSYERALRLTPRDKDVLFNLQVARLATVDRVPELPEMFYQSWWRRWRELLDVRALTFLTAAVHLLFVGALIFRLLSRSSLFRRRLKTAAFALGLLLGVLALTWASRMSDLQSRDAAVVMTPAVEVSSAPGGDGTVIFTVHAGLKLRILRSRGEWSEIRLSDGKEGWLPADCLEII